MQRSGSKIETQSAKLVKGRRLQQWVRDLLIEKVQVHPGDVESRDQWVLVVKI